MGVKDRDADLPRYQAKRLLAVRLRRSQSKRQSERSTRLSDDLLALARYYLEIAVAAMVGVVAAVLLAVPFVVALWILA